MTSIIRTNMSALRNVVASALDRRRVIPALCVALAAGLAGCSVSSEPVVGVAPEPAGSLVITNATIVDTATGGLTPGMTVVVADGKITRIDKSAAPADPALKSFDAQGKFLVPGFNDLHAHPLGYADTTNQLALLLANGVTGVRLMNGMDKWLEARKNGRLLPSNFSPEILTMPGEVLSPVNAFTAAEAVAEIDKQKAEGADFIKVVQVPPDVFPAIAAEAKKVGLPFEGHVPSNVDAIKASEMGYRSIEHLGPLDTILVDCSTDEAAIKEDMAKFHVQKPPSLPGFIMNNVIVNKIIMKKVMRMIYEPLLPNLSATPTLISRLRHVIDTYNEEKCRNVAKTLAANGTWQAPTLIRDLSMDLGDDPRFTQDPNLRYITADVDAIWQDLAKEYTKAITPEQRKTMTDFFQLQLKFTKLLDDAGTMMMAGSDLGGQWEIAGFSLHQEFKLLAQAGLTPLKVLQMTTINGAKFLGREATMGSVAVGKNANLVLLDANPVESVDNFDKINAVVRDGHLYPKSVLDQKLAEIARPASKPN